MHTDYLIVGSGLSGAVIARMLKDAGKRVVVIERRSQWGGNVHDHVHASGIRVHTYGPHYFRTSSERIWNFANRFSSFYRYEAALKTLVDGRYENWPIAASYIRSHVGEKWCASFQGTPTNFEEACLAMMPRQIYEKFVKGYTEKQWGVQAHLLDASLAGRFDVREDDEPRLKLHTYQGIPTHGYTEWMNRLLSGIPLILNCDYREQCAQFKVNKLTVFTGPIDEFFGFDLGRLTYRGQVRTHTYYPEADFMLPCGQVNNPSPTNGPHIRTLEWKHMLEPTVAARIKGTLLTTETTITPTDPSNYEYPFPDQTNRALYQKYRERAARSVGVLICGRLGEYRYFDMDQAIGRAMMLADRILAEESVQGEIHQASLLLSQLGDEANDSRGLPSQSLTKPSISNP